MWGSAAANSNKLGYSAAHIEFCSETPSQKSSQSELLEPDEKFGLLGLRDAVGR